MNDIFLRALARQPTERTPLWVMRQAGRYLPEYRELRKRAGSFLNLLRSPELACEATMQPIDRFALDAAIVFSDILAIPDALDMGLGFAEGEGPYLERPVRTAAELDRLGEIDLDKMSYVFEAVRQCKRGLDGRVPLIGFAGGPFTLACYMIEGRGGEFLQARRLMHEDPALFERLISLNAEAVVASLVAQAQAGADALMIFESWAGLVPQHKAEATLIAPLAKMVAKIKEAVPGKPTIAFLRNAGDLVEAASRTGVDALGIDWRCDLGAASQAAGGRVALQGNMDPAVLLAGGEAIEKEVGRIVGGYRPATGHIFNLGHGIHKETPPENMEALVQAVAKHSAARYGG